PAFRTPPGAAARRRRGPSRVTRRWTPRRLRGLPAAAALSRGRRPARVVRTPDSRPLPRPPARPRRRPAGAAATGAARAGGASAVAAVAVAASAAATDACRETDAVLQGAALRGGAPEETVQTAEGPDGAALRDEVPEGTVQTAAARTDAVPEDAAPTAAVLRSRVLGSAAQTGTVRADAALGSTAQTGTTRTDTAPEARTNAAPMAAALRDGVLDRAAHEDAVRVGAVLEGVETGTGPLGVADTGLGGLSEVDTGLGGLSEVGTGLGGPPVAGRARPVPGKGGSSARSRYRDAPVTPGVCHDLRGNMLVIGVASRLNPSASQRTRNHRGGGDGALLVGRAGFADVRPVPDHLGDQVAVAQQHGGVGAAGLAGVDVVLEAGLQERRLPRVRHVTDRADPFAQHGALGGLPAGPLQIEPAGRHLGGTA